MLEERLKTELFDLEKKKVELNQISSPKKSKD